MGLTVVVALVAPAAILAGGARELTFSLHGDTQQQQQQAGEGQQDPDERAGGTPGRPDEDERRGGDGATLLLTPSHIVTERGARIRLSLSVLGADDLRRLPATVRFDPGVLELAAVRLGSAWDNGTEPVLLYDASRPGEVIIGLGLLDRTATGVTGSAELLELEFHARGAGDARLRIERFAAIGPHSKPQLTTALSAQVLVR